jgi:hypothetical protein
MNSDILVDGPSVGRVSGEPVAAPKAKEGSTGSAEADPARGGKPGTADGTHQREADAASPATRVARGVPSVTQTIVRGIAQRVDTEAGRAGGGQRNGHLDDTLAAMVDCQEVTALIKFVTERGLDKESKITGPLSQAVADLQGATDPKVRTDRTKQVIKLYGGLSAVTYPTMGVNGKTVLDSDDIRNCRKIRILGIRFKPRAVKSLAWLIGSFAFAVLTEGMRVYYSAEGSSGGTSTGWVQAILDNRTVFDLYQLVLIYLLPFFWGAVGASIYLLKNASDLVAQRAYDAQSAQGTAARVILGGVFGAVIVHLFFDSIPETASTFALGPSAAAFLSGLGIRAVYGAFEKVVDTLATWIGGLGKPTTQTGQSGAQSGGG